MRYLIFWLYRIFSNRASVSGWTTNGVRSSTSMPWRHLCVQREPGTISEMSGAVQSPIEMTSGWRKAFFFFFFCLFLQIDVFLMYSIILVSGIQHNDPYFYILWNGHHDTSSWHLSPHNFFLNFKFNCFSCDNF